MSKKASSVDIAAVYAPIGNLLPNFSHSRLILPISITVISLYALLVNSSWHAVPDSALYISLAESIHNTGTYTFNGEPHTLVPPGLPLYLAGFVSLLGPGFLTYRIAMAVAGLVTVFSAYLLFKKLLGQNGALIFGTLFAINYTLVSNSTMILADVLFAAASLASIVALISASQRILRTGTGIMLIMLSGILFGFAGVIRINGIGLPIAGFIFLVSGFHFQHRLAKFLIPGLYLLLGYAPYLAWLYVKATFPKSGSEGTYFNAVFNRSIGDQLRTIWDAFIGYFPEITTAITGLNIKTGIIEFILPAILLLGAVAAFRRGDRFLVPLVAIQFFGLLLSSPGDRYLIFMIPIMLLFLFLAVAESVVPFLKKRTDNKIGSKIVVGSIAFLALSNGLHDIVPIVSARTPIEINGAESVKSVPFFRASEYLKKQSSGCVVLTTSSRVIHYLSGCETVSLVRSGVPDHEIWVSDFQGLNELIKRDKNVYVFYDDKHSSQFSSLLTGFSNRGFVISEIPEAGTPPRFKLYRINRHREAAMTH